MQTRKHTLVFLFTLVLGQFLFAQEPVSVDPVSSATTEVADIMTIGFGLAVLLVLAIAFVFLDLLKVKKNIFIAVASILIIAITIPLLIATFPK